MNNRILIIDESEHYMLMIASRLLNYGYDEIHTAFSGTDGFSKIDLVQPGVVIIETRLSDVDSLQLCRRVKREYGDHIKVVLMVGMAEKFNVAEFELAGADAWAVKTYDVMLLMAAIKKVLYLANFTDNSNRMAVS